MGVHLAQWLLIGLLGVFATLAHAQEVGSQRWKTEDGRELYELRPAENALAFERITPTHDQMYGEFFKGTVNKQADRYSGTASAAVLQITQGRPTHTCTIQMSVTLTVVTPGRIEGTVRPERIDPACAPDNFSTTMTAPAFAWIPATADDTPLPQVQRRIEASIQFMQRMESAQQDTQRETRNRQAQLEPRQRPNQRLRECEAALRQQHVFCSAYFYPGRPFLPTWGACNAAQANVQAVCY